MENRERRKMSPVYLDVFKLKIEDRFISRYCPLSFKEIQSSKIFLTASLLEFKPLKCWISTKLYEIEQMLRKANVQPF